MQERKLYFRLKYTNIAELQKRFYDTGKCLLNSSEWRGKEPRSCAITGFSGSNMHFDIEVSYKPNGYITYVGNTKYNGWTAHVLAKDANGTLIDENGKPLEDGKSPVYRPIELFKEVDFNSLNFGYFIEETNGYIVNKVTYSDFNEDLHASGAFCHGINMTTFTAPRKQRPNAKIVLNNAPTQNYSDSINQWFNINNNTPHLEHVLINKIFEIVSGFLEGRLSPLAIAGP